MLLIEASCSTLEYESHMKGDLEIKGGEGSGRKENISFKSGWGQCLSYTGWTQKHSLISSSYKIKTYWNIFINMYGTADTLTQEIFNFPARRQRAVKCKMALTSQQRAWCVLEKMTRCSASGPRDHRTWPCVTFSFGGTWRTESMYLHYPQLWMSCRDASLQLSTRSRRICCRESGPS